MLNIQLEFPDVFGVNTNRKGVDYLHNMYTGEVVAKRCTECTGWYFLTDFNKAGKGFAGTHSLCRSCHAERNAEHRRFNKLFNDTFLKGWKTI